MDRAFQAEGKVVVNETTIKIQVDSEKLETEVGEAKLFLSRNLMA